MKGSLLQALGPPTLPQQRGPSSASTSRSTLLSQFRSYRPVHRHSSSHASSSQQQVLSLDTASLSNTSTRNFRSSFHGDSIASRQEKPYTKDAGMLSVVKPPRFLVHSSNKSFEQSQQQRGSFPTLVKQSTRTGSIALDSKFSYPNVDQNSTHKFNSVGNLDEASSSPVVEVPPGLKQSRKSRAASSSLEHRRSSLAETNGSDQLVSSPSLYGRSDVRVRPKYAAQAILGSFEDGLNSRSRSSQNDAHRPLNNYRSPLSIKYGPVLKTVPKVNTSNRVEQEIDGQRRVQKMATELHYRREDRSLEISSRRHENSLSFQAARHDNHVVRPEVRLSSPQTQGGAAKWREAARKIEQDRRSAHGKGGIEAGRGNTDSLNVELEPVGGFENGRRGPTAREVSLLCVSDELSLARDGQFEAHSISGSSVPQNFVSAEPPQLVSVDVLSEKRESRIQPDGEQLWVNSEVVVVNNLPTDVLSEELESRIQPDGEQRWINSEVLVVNNVPTAEVVVEKLRGQYKDFIHACDTEVAEIDVKKESPVGHGRVICFSIYCGPMTDFGGGKCRLWVDVLGKRAVLDVFKSYFEDPSIKKVWHNYSFDKHILANHDINAQGFHADTMHLARLYDSARTVAQGGYSLEGLTADVHVMGGHWGGLNVEETSSGKRSMKHLFGKPNVKKNGEEGKLRVVQPVEELQTQPEWRDKWIQYSSFDSVCTWCLWKSLQEKLKKKDWIVEGKARQGQSMYNFYLDYLQPFGKLLVQMEATGMMLDREHLAKIEDIAVKQQAFSANQFKKWAAKQCPDAIHMNVGSDAQIRQLLFGGKKNKNDPDKSLETRRVFNAPNTENYMEEGRKTPKKTRPFILSSFGADIPVDSYTSGGWPAVGGAALKSLAGKVSIDYTMLDEEEPVEDMPSVASGEDSAVLTSTGVKGGSEEDLSVYGKAYNAFGGGKVGKEACMALAALCEVASINTLISNFIQPLQGSDIKGPDGRVHCSLNINTETGRLSARRPSLQNQPALEKDRYKIRQAFVAEPGNSLIVADYGQLELRILAHLTDCKSMLKAFSDGGDFHSRTAMNMYPHVRNAVDNGDVILEWEPRPGEKKPPVPLLKDMFGAERRKAKMLNFSIAYGKTAMGLSKDWKVSLDEAKSTVELWYSERQEVRHWQKQRIKEANETRYVHTLLGRTRHFPDVKYSSRLVQGHMERAAINTPVQGSAADVAMCAMLEISANKELQSLGWKLVLQVHDEVILEGPSESAVLAKDIVVNCMTLPFGGKNILRVALAVDAKYAQSWYAAK